MKISIITSTFNSEKTLQDTLDSIQGQNYSEVETIVIDGGSQDGTLELIKKNKSITKYISEQDNGIYDALNKGVKLATGEIIGFVHSDDLLADTSILTKIAEKIKSEGLDGIYGDLDYVDKNNTNKIIRAWKSCSFQPKLLKQGWMPAHPTLFLKKEVYEKHGLFDTSYKIAADYDFMLRILKDESLKFGYLPEVITKMRVGGASNRSIKNIIQKTKEDYRAVTSNNVGGFLSILRKNTSKIKQFILK